jgi:hypothetical protein
MFWWCAFFCLTLNRHFPNLLECTQNNSLKSRLAMKTAYLQWITLPVSISSYCFVCTQANSGSVYWCIILVNSFGFAIHYLCKIVLDCSVTHVYTFAVDDCYFRRFVTLLFYLICNYIRFHIIVIAVSRSQVRHLFCETYIQSTVTKL